MLTYINVDQQSHVRNWLLSKTDSQGALNIFTKIIEESKLSFIDKVKQEVLKDNLKNWRLKDFPLGFRRELENLDSKGEHSEINKKLEEESKAQIDTRLELLSNILGIKTSDLMERTVD